MHASSSWLSILVASYSSRFSGFVSSPLVFFLPYLLFLLILIFESALFHSSVSQSVFLGDRVRRTNYKRHSLLKLGSQSSWQREMKKCIDKKTGNTFQQTFQHQWPPFKSKRGNTPRLMFLESGESRVKRISVIAYNTYKTITGTHLLLLNWSPVNAVKERRQKEDSQEEEEVRRHKKWHKKHPASSSCYSCQRRRKKGLGSPFTPFFLSALFLPWGHHIIDLS